MSNKESSKKLDEILLQDHFHELFSNHPQFFEKLDSAFELTEREKVKTIYTKNTQNVK